MYIALPRQSIMGSSNEGGTWMTVQERIQVSRLLMQMKDHKDVAKQLGLKDASSLNVTKSKQNNGRIYSMK
jgi:hypothetical protein